MYYIISYSHLSNKRGGWNKHGGGAKAAKSINVEVGILQLECSKLIENNFVEGDFFLWRVEFFKISKRDFTFIREMRVMHKKREIQFY